MKDAPGVLYSTCVGQGVPHELANRWRSMRLKAWFSVTKTANRKKRLVAYPLVVAIQNANEETIET
jgi:hypothetical protein